MTRQLAWIVLSAVGVASSTGANAASFAGAVIAYQPGSTPAAGLTNAATALGGPTTLIAVGTAFEGVVSPFNPPYEAGDLVSIGEGGSLMLRLANFAIPTAGPELGFFTNAGLGDQDFPNGLAATDFSQPFTKFGIDSALVEVSEDGAAWVSLGEHVFDIPANPFLDLTNPFSPTPGSAPADPGLPFVGGLNDFAGKNYGEIKTLLGGSAGGTWLDISATGLARVGYVRLSVADDGNALTALNFELDAMSIATAAVGAPVPEPGALMLLVFAAGFSVVASRRR